MVLVPQDAVCSELKLLHFLKVLAEGAAMLTLCLAASEGEDSNCIQDYEVCSISLA